MCRDCGGIWLDRGEIDKLVLDGEPVVLATALDGPAAAAIQDGQAQPPTTPVDGMSASGEPKESKKSKKSDDHKKSSKKKSKKKRKKGWADQLEDILDDVLDFD